ncbi:MAG: SusC/RagA family TonB-linked outer membrane protein, partial [Bacteroidota bacterium]
YGSTSTFSLPNQLVNEELRPALSSAYEAGLDLRFFNNRVGVDIAVYQRVNIDQILSITVPGSSGFSSALINAGNITSRGVEIALNATPVRNDNLTWDMNLNWARNRSEVIELADGIDNRRLDGWGWGGFSINAPVGEEWGTMRGRGYAIYENENDPNDPANGQRIVNENGYVFENNKTLGTLLPDFTGGFRNTLVFKGVELTAFVEFQKGGSFHSVTKMFNAYSGLSTETVGLNDKGNPLRDPVDQGGGVKVEGVTAEGETAEYYVEAQSYFSGNLFALNERWIYDQSYVKLRELRVGYTIPKKLLGSSPIQDLSLAVIGRNLWLIHSNVDGIDPSEISPGSNGYVFQENGILPSTRSIGVNLRLGF